MSQYSHFISKSLPFHPGFALLSACFRSVCSPLLSGLLACPPVTSHTDRSLLTSVVMSLFNMSVTLLIRKMT